MSTFLLRRLSHAVLTLIGISVVVFALVRLIPGDPVHVYVGGPSMRGVPTEVVDSVRRELGLDQSLPLQYVRWLAGAVRGDLGRSYVNRAPVLSTIAEKAPATIELNLIALLLAALIGVPAGLWAAARQGSGFDRWSSRLAFLLFALPNFWVALVLMDLLAVKLELVPLYGMGAVGSYRLPLPARIVDHLHHLVLPAIVLAYAQIAVYLRFTRTAVADVIDREYIAAARARGIPEHQVLVRHALRNALIPLVTLAGLVIPTLLSGSIIVEQIFEWDGLGRLFFSAILSRDYPMVMGLTLVTGVFVVLANLVADLAYGWADPRVAVEGREVRS